MPTTPHFPADWIGPAREQHWTVVRDPDQANGHVDFGKLEISIPPGGVTEATDAIRLHEGGHKVYTDPLAPGGIAKGGTDLEAYLRAMFEEVRIDATLRARHKGPDGLALDVSRRHDDADFTATMKKIPTLDVKELALYYLQYHPTRRSKIVQPVWMEIRKAILEHRDIGATHRGGDELVADLDIWADSVERSALDPVKSGEKRDEATAWIMTRYFADPIKPPEPAPLKAEVQQAIAEALAAMEAAEGTTEDTKPGVGPGGANPLGKDSREAPAEKAPPKHEKTHVGTVEMQGRMQICDHVRPGRKTRFMRTPNGATDQGTELAHIERYAEDMAVFKHRRPGGAVLIDCSGSMSWPMELLQQAIKELPGTTIATYQGVRMGRSTAIQGERLGTGPLTEEQIERFVKRHPEALDYNGRLCIIARGGRMAPMVVEEDLTGGNEVDYEALCWLAKQPGPRLWLSDGMVCGGELEMTKGRATLASACQEVLTRALIWRTVDVPAGIKYLRNGRGIKGDIPFGTGVLARVAR